MTDIDFDQLENTLADDFIDKDNSEDVAPKHMELVNAMMHRGFKFVNEMPAIPIGNQYEFGWRAIHKAMVAFNPYCTERSRNEAIKTLTHMGEYSVAAHHRYIAFQNGVLDVVADKFYHGAEFDSVRKGIVPVVIPHDYDAFAQEDAAVEKLLNGISCNDESIRINLEETIGLAMSRLSTLGKAVWMYGTGENGKSTFIDALEYVVGKNNSCYLMLDDMKGSFNTQMMVGKLISVSDDQTSSSIEKSVLGTVKKIVTGQSIKIEGKGKDPYNATIFATIIVTSNEPASFSDTTPGSLRRWHMIPLFANFGQQVGERDINLKDKLHTEQAAQWMIKLGIEGLKRIIQNEGMTKTKYSESAIQEARERSNSVFAFLAEHPQEEFLANPNVEVWYWKYTQVTKYERGGKAFDMTAFVRMVNTEYGFTTANSGRYNKCDSEIQPGGIANQHGKRPGDKYRKFVPKS